MGVIGSYSPQTTVDASDKFPLEDGGSGETKQAEFSDIVAAVVAQFLWTAVPALKAYRASSILVLGTGSGVAIDTSRCLHMGSRVQPGAFRLCLYLQYCTTAEQTNVFDVGRYKKDRVRTLAIKHSVAANANVINASSQMA